MAVRLGGEQREVRNRKLRSSPALAGVSHQLTSVVMGREVGAVLVRGQPVGPAAEAGAAGSRAMLV